MNQLDIHPVPSSQCASSGNSSLHDRGWKWFRYDRIFEIRKGKRLTKQNMEFGETPFVSAIDSNNGYRDFISEQPIHDGNTITVNYNGSVAEAFYQPRPYWASDDCNVIYSKHMTPYVGMFVSALIKMEKYRFNYGRKWYLERMLKSWIKLPVNDRNQPDWQFMEDYIKSLPYSSSL